MNPVDPLNAYIKFFSHFKKPHKSHIRPNPHSNPIRSLYVPCHSENNSSKVSSIIYIHPHQVGIDNLFIHSYSAVTNVGDCQTMSPSCNFRSTLLKKVFKDTHTVSCPMNVIFAFFCDGHVTLRSPKLSRNIIVTSQIKTDKGRELEIAQARDFGNRVLPILLRSRMGLALGSFEFRK
jgi:hypothetical protein